jgi:uncharacterized delta-60 repeat protein
MKNAPIRFLGGLPTIILLAALTTAPTPVHSQTADDFNPGASGSVYSLAVQADGKILAGGRFTTLGGQTRTNIGRLNADGNLDTSFNPGAGGGSIPKVSSLAVQADGRILVGGDFTSLGEQNRNCIGRLNADGSLDTAFNPGASGGYYGVNSMIVQADGKIVVGGGFATLGGQNRNHIGRLNADGSVDTGFNPGADNDVSSLIVQADGKILVGGRFTTLGGQARTNIARLNPDGSLDTTFNPGTSGGSSGVYSMAVQTDGKIVVGGYFTNLCGQERYYLGRLNADGSLDISFNLGAAGFSGVEYVNSLAVQADGKIVVGGHFTNLGGQPRSCIGRLNADGSVDTTFNPGASGGLTDVITLALQADGKIVAGGTFTTLGGQPRDYIGRLNTTELATQSLSSDGSPITWLRGGTSPEVWRTSFEVCTNGTDWINVGEGRRIAGGWQATGVSFPTNAAIRARGFVSDGGSSSWFVESSAALLITTQPVSQSVNPGETVSFGVIATSPLAMFYQWRKDNTNIAGATMASLTLTNVQEADAGNYDVVVTNSLGSVTSATAVLNVIPAILDATFNPGASEDVYSLAVQADGKILVGGIFTTLGGHTCANIGRLHTDGSVDTSFNPGADNYVNSLAVQADGKILVGGQFATLGGQTCNRIGRLNADGTLDVTFDPGNVNGEVHSIAVQSDGKILVGGNFTLLGGQARDCIGRLNADGSLDTSFNPVLIADSYPDVYSLALQADGRIVVGGHFNSIGGQARTNIGRLDADGSLDATFHPAVGEAGNKVYAMMIQGDGRIVVAGDFWTLGEESRSNIGRLNADGSVDISFHPDANGMVFSLALQADWKILVGGWFSELGGQTRNHLGRLNADGSLDGDFNPDANERVYCFAMQTDGKIIVGGEFTTLAGQPRNHIGRLNNVATPTINTNPPVLLANDSHFGMFSNGFSFTVSAATGQVVVIEASANLVNWLPLSTNTIATNAFYFSDSTTTNYPARFYRAKLSL